MSKLKVKLGKLELQNPVVLASGTFDKSIVEKVEPSKLGGVITKTITLLPKIGNPLPHIIKTKYGWLNSVGLKNPGLDEYLKKELPFWQKHTTSVITSIGGNTEAEYIKIAKILNSYNQKAIEVNISCPNIDHGGLAFGTDVKTISRLIGKIRKVYDYSLIVKLSPNVTDIALTSRAALSGGADILAIANTLLGMEIKNKRAVFDRKVGGYSGGAIKPIILRMVYEVYKNFKCPIIGGGGVESFIDALDYMMVGATAISIGSANFINPKLSVNIVDDLDDYLTKEKTSLNKIRGII